MGKKSLASAFTTSRSVRAPISEDAARSFESAGTVAESSRLRRQQPAGERLTFYIPSDLATQLRIACASERRSMSDAATDALREWVQRHVSGSGGTETQKRSVTK